MIVRESINFERGVDPKEALFGIRPGTLVTNDGRWNGVCIMIEVFLRAPTPDDLRRWDPLHEHTKDKYMTYRLGLLQDPIENAHGEGKHMPSTFFPHQFSGFDIVFQSGDLRKLSLEENEIVLRGLEEPRHSKNVQEISDQLEEYTGVKMRMPEKGKK